MVILAAPLLAAYTAVAFGLAWLAVLAWLGLGARFCCFAVDGTSQPSISITLAAECEWSDM